MLIYTLMCNNNNDNNISILLYESQFLPSIINDFFHVAIPQVVCVVSVCINCLAKIITAVAK